MPKSLGELLRAELGITVPDYAAASLQSGLWPLGNGPIATISGPGSGATITNPTTNNLTTSGSLTVSGDVNANAANFIGFLARSYLSSPLNGQLNFVNAAATIGVGFDFLTDGTLKVRTRAIADTAILDVSRYSAGGTLGVATFGPAGVTSITVKGGIITAIS